MVGRGAFERKDREGDQSRRGEGWPAAQDLLRRNLASASSSAITSWALTPLSVRSGSRLLAGSDVIEGHPETPRAVVIMFIE